MKKIVICCDGTNNQFGTSNTNVVKLFQTIVRSPKEQQAYYDPGVGTMPEPGAFSRFQRFMSVVAGLAFGRGITQNIVKAYTFLMDWYEAGDEIYLFGFSRGSYTVRALAGVLHNFGLLPAGMQNLVPYILRLAKEINDIDEDDKEAETKYWRIVRGFRHTFARVNENQGKKTLRVQVHFLGLWDTVSSVGWVWDPKRFPSTAKNPSVSIVRHAISIDERRWFFRQNHWKPLETQDVLEVWFPGDHCDVGGGHGKEAGLANCALVWLLAEAKDAGLLLEPERWNKLQDEATREASWRQPIHDLLMPWWLIPQLVPKFAKGRLLPRWGMTIGRKIPFCIPRKRVLPNGAQIHNSCLLRLREPDLTYRPSNLDQQFVDCVLSLKQIPKLISYSAL